MPSSISSSRTIAATAVLALAVYGLAIALWRPVIRLYPDQDAFNLARAERILIGDGAVETVIVGSSLGVRIPDDWLPPGWLNVSLGGKSAATGLALLQASPIRPRRILVEANTLGLARDDGFVQSVRGVVPLSLRKHVLAARQEYRPVNLMLTLAGNLRGGINAPRPSGSLTEACATLAAAQTRDAVSADVVQREVARALAQPVAPDTAAHLALLKPVLSGLAAQGAQVWLFEWPTDPELMNAAAALAIRREVKAAFADIAMLALDGAPVETEDGLHLAPFSARRAACALVRAAGP